MEETRYWVYKKPELEGMVIAKFKHLDDAKDYARKELVDEREYMLYTHQVSNYYVKDYYTGEIFNIK